MWFTIYNTSNGKYLLDNKYIDMIENTGCYDLEKNKDNSNVYSCECKIYIEDLYDLIELYKLLKEELIITEDYVDNEIEIEIYDSWRE